VSALEPLLQKAGFTEYEARAYVALLYKSPQTGYELAKTSRVPRGNIYTVLQKLESRGAATRVVSSDAVRYMAVSPELVMQRMRTSFLEMMQDLERHLQSVTQMVDGEHVESFDGYDNLMFFAADVLRGTKHHATVALHMQESLALAPVFSELCQSVSLTTLCLTGCARQCQSCCGAVHSLTVPVSQERRWFTVVADGAVLVAGDISGDKVTGIRTRLPLLTQMAGLFLQQSLFISQLLQTGQIDEQSLPLGFRILTRTF
jgi:HTH-type transcriptional regulator, sugar sensing transcriptional regulator